MSENTVRVECLYEDLADTWIEVPDRGWRLAELDALNNTSYSPAEVVRLVVANVLACNLQILPDPDAPEEAGPAPEGPITSPFELTENILRYHMDARIMNWLIGAIYEGGRHTFLLAPLAVKASSAQSDKIKVAAIKSRS